MRHPQPLPFATLVPHSLPIPPLQVPPISAPLPSSVPLLPSGAPPPSSQSNTGRHSGGAPLLPSPPSMASASLAPPGGGTGCPGFLIPFLHGMDAVRMGLSTSTSSSSHVTASSSSSSVVATPPLPGDGSNSGSLFSLPSGADLAVVHAGSPDPVMVRRGAAGA